GMRLQPACQLEGALRLRLHAYLQGLQPLEQHPGVERREAGTRGAQKRVHAVHHQLASAQHGATEHPALAVQVLRRRMYYKVGSELDRTLQGRAAEAVIDYKHCSGAVRQVGERTDVVDLRKRIGGRLDIE